jgi:ABC-type transport system involved in multi-copper enzyme maturation permease subunit
MNLGITLNAIFLYVEPGEGLFAYLGLVGIFLLILGVGCYFLPTIIGYYRKRSNVAAIFLLNLFLGWTFIGWIVSLVWALANDNNPQTIVVNNHLSSDRTINPIIAQPVQENLQTLSNAQSLHTIQAESSPINSHQEKINQLQQLKQLFDSEVLTKEEFDEQKSQILAA